MDGWINLVRVSLVYVKSCFKQTDALTEKLLACYAIYKKTSFAPVDISKYTVELTSLEFHFSM